MRDQVTDCALRCSRLLGAHEAGPGPGDETLIRSRFFVAGLAQFQLLEFLVLLRRFDHLQRDHSVFVSQMGEESAGQRKL